MATYYVRQDGNDSNTGLGSTTGLAWRTLQKALGATGIGSGDTVYIAPGHYNETVTIGGTYSAETQIIGDPTASQFLGVNAGFVRHSQYAATNNTAANLTQLIVGVSKNFLHFKNIYFEIASQSSVSNFTINGRNNKLTSCVFVNNLQNSSLTSDINLSAVAGQNLNAQINNCIFYGMRYFSLDGTTASGDASSITNSAFLNVRTESISIFQVTCSLYNCLVLGGTTGLRNYTGTTTTMRNCIISNCTTGISNQGTLNGDNNRIIGNITTVTNTGTYTAGSNSVTAGTMGLEFGYSLLHNLVNQVIFGSIPNSANASFGTTSGAPTTDMFGVAWSGTSPDAGAITNRSIGAVGQYLPTERNASTITIAPGSTSQSIELYLGATGLTASTSGLTARYNRTRTASVSIPLVARTIAQAWTSGGFAEVDATNMPGVYRLDVPDAALAAGADDVTIVVRGASGTNGAVITVKLSSGGLTSAQTASAVLDAVGSSYVTAGSIGYAIQNSNVASISGSTAAADELEGALLHNGTDYISAELVTPVTSAALVRMGPFEVRADGLGASDPLDIQKGAQHGIDIQCVDNNGAGIDITSATVTAKVYNSGATLVDTYSCTATYAADGRATFTIDTTVTNSPGTYTTTITRTTGASDTQVFGPLRIYVRDI